MGKRGPKKTDKQVLKLRGSWRGDIEDETPILSPQRVRCPKWVSPAAQKEWRTLAPVLNKYGLVNELNKVFWCVYVSALADLKTIEKEIGLILAAEPRTGLFPATNELSKTRAVNLRRLISIRVDLTKQLIGILKEAGIAPEIIKPPTVVNTKARFFKPREPGPYAKAEPGDGDKPKHDPYEAA